VQYPTISQVHVRRDLESLQYTRVSIHVPTLADCPDCDYDVFTGASDDIACTTCRGTGKVTTWHVSHASVRAMWVDDAAPRWGALATGQVGDCWLAAPYHYDALFKKVKDTEDAYITVDDRKIKPFSITRMRVEGTSTLDVRCSIVHHEAV
jgi:hypothetical protein